MLSEEILKNKQIVIGFDAFIDKIYKPIRQHLGSTPEFFPSMNDFGQFIADSYGKSANCELTLFEKRPGGNAVLMAQGLLKFHTKIDLFANFGSHDHPIFEKICKQTSKAINLGNPGSTTALEFLDGKLLLGEMGDLPNLTFDKILEKIPLNDLVQTLENCDAFCSVNWTMTTNLNDIWEKLLKIVFPRVKKRIVFYVDLSDPRKRDIGCLKMALELLKKFQSFCEVILSLNESENAQAHQALGLEIDPDNLAANLLNELEISAVVIHALKQAHYSSKDVQCIIEGSYTATPKISTGAGDQFNAGFLAAHLCNLSPEECLVVANACSGFFVRTGQSATIDEICDFIQESLKTRQSF